MTKGLVYLIGAGPGDEELFTFKGADRLSKCDVVLYDYLANKKLLSYCKSNVELVYVGKKAGGHTKSQDDINRLLVEYANAGKIVGRLKGGDPLVFGRGGEEALFLIQNNIKFEFIPGITSSVAAATYAGIPITQRGYTSSMTLVTGNEDPTKEDTSINWSALANLDSTLVFYMGVKNLPKIVDKLIENGLDINTPIACIRWATYNYQEVMTSTLKEVVSKAKEINLQAPVITIVGKVVELRKSLEWFDNRPLSGKSIVVTRSRSQSSKLVKELNNLGAEVFEIPVIEIQKVNEKTKIIKAINEISNYNWLVFTSVNGVNYFFDELFDNNKDVRSLSHLKIAVIGIETGKLLKNYGLVPDLIPAKFTSEGLSDLFETVSDQLKGKKVLMPISNIARDVISDKLIQLGAIPEIVPIYNTICPKIDSEVFEKINKKKNILVTFTSSSTVDNFVKLLGENDIKIDYKGISIGPITTKTAIENNIDIIIEPKEHTIDGLINEVVKYFSK